VSPKSRAPRPADQARGEALRGHEKDSSRSPGVERLSPVVVSDLTALVVVGLTARQFRAFLREHEVPHAKVGRRTLARLEDVLDAIDRSSGRGATPARWNEEEIIARAVGGRR
jgi:hypothetical protein